MPRGAGTYGSKIGRPKKKKVKKRKIESGLRSAKGGQASSIRGESREGMIVKGGQKRDSGAHYRAHGEKAKNRIKKKPGLSRKEMLQHSDSRARAIPAQIDAAIEKKDAPKKAAFKKERAAVKKKEQLADAAPILRKGKQAAQKKAKAKKATKAKVSKINKQVADIKPGFPKSNTLFGSTHDQTKAQVKKLTKKKVAPAKPKKTRVAIRPGSPASTAVSIAKSVKAPHDYGADAVDKYLSMTKSVTDAVRRKAKKGRKKFVAATGLKIR